MLTPGAVVSSSGTSPVRPVRGMASRLSFSQSSPALGGRNGVEAALTELRQEMGCLRSELSGVRAKIDGELRKRNVQIDISEGGLATAVGWLVEELTARDQETQQLKSDLTMRSPRYPEVSVVTRELSPRIRAASPVVMQDISQPTASVRVPSPVVSRLDGTVRVSRQSSPVVVSRQTSPVVVRPDASPVVARGISQPDTYVRVASPAAAREFPRWQAIAGAEPVGVAVPLWRPPEVATGRLQESPRQSPSPVVRLDSPGNVSIPNLTTSYGIPKFRTVDSSPAPLLDNVAIGNHVHARPKLVATPVASPRAVPARNRSQSPGEGSNPKSLSEFRAVSSRQPRSPEASPTRPTEAHHGVSDDFRLPDRRPKSAKNNARRSAKSKERHVGGVAGSITTGSDGSAGRPAPRIDKEMPRDLDRWRAPRRQSSGGTPREAPRSSLQRRPSAGGDGFHSYRSTPYKHERGLDPDNFNIDSLRQRQPVRDNLDELWGQLLQRFPEHNVFKEAPGVYRFGDEDGCLVHCTMEGGRLLVSTSSAGLPIPAEVFLANVLPEESDIVFGPGSGRQLAAETAAEPLALGEDELKTEVAAQLRDMVAARVADNITRTEQKFAPIGLHMHAVVGEGRSTRSSVSDNQSNRNSRVSVPGSLSSRSQRKNGSCKTTSSERNEATGQLNLFHQPGVWSPGAGSWSPPRPSRNVRVK